MAAARFVPRSPGSIPLARSGNGRSGRRRIRATKRPGAASPRIRSSAGLARLSPFPFSLCVKPRVIIYRGGQLRYHGRGFLSPPPSRDTSRYSWQAPQRPEEGR